LQHTRTHARTHISTLHLIITPCCNTTFYAQINWGNSFCCLTFCNPQVLSSVRIQTERVANTGTHKHRHTQIQKNKFITFSAGVLCCTQPSGEICPMLSSNWECSKMYYGSVNGSLGTVLIPAIGRHLHNDGDTVRSDTHSG